MAGADMETGRLDQRITLQQRQETTVSGRLNSGYMTVATVWGHVLSQRGNEALEAARVNARDNIRVCLRFRADVDATWRIEWNGQPYNIVNVDRSNRRLGWLWLTAQAKGAV